MTAEGPKRGARGRPSGGSPSGGSPSAGSSRGGSPSGGSSSGGSSRGGSSRAGSSRGGSPRGGSPRDLGPFLLWLVLVYLALTVTAVVFERPIVAATAPLARAGLRVFASELDVNTLTVESGRLAASVSTEAARPGGGGGTRRVRMSVAANPRTLLIAPILTLSVLLAWRFRSRSQRAVAYAAGGVLTAVALMHDLANGVATGVHEQLGSPRGAAKFLRFVLENGGRQLFAIVAAAAAIGLAAHVAKRGVPELPDAPGGRAERRRRQREREHALAAQ